MSTNLKSRLREFAASLVPAQTKQKILEGPLRKYFVESVISHEKAAEKRARLKAGGRPTLFHLDVHICDHCNLNCKGCEHYSSLAKPSFADLDVIERDLRRLSELFENIEQIYLLGGEPLLHERVNDFVNMTREIFPRTRLYLMTNGILVTRMNEDFWKTLSKANCTLLCDSYPINLDVEKIESRAAEHRVKLEWMPVTEKFFKIPLDLTQSQDPAKSFNRCRGLSNCAIVREGKLYGCAHIAYADILQEEFADQASLESITPSSADFIDIFAAADGDEVIDRLMSPVPWCGHCDFDSFSTYEWGRTNRDFSEWFKTETEKSA